VVVVGASTTHFPVVLTPKPNHIDNRPHKLSRPETWVHSGGSIFSTHHGKEQTIIKSIINYVVANTQQKIPLIEVLSSV